MLCAVLTVAQLLKRPDSEAEDWSGRDEHLSSRLNMVTRPSVCLGSPSGALASVSRSHLTTTCPCRLQPRSGRFQLAGRAETLLLQQKGHGQRPGALIAGFVPAQEMQAPVHFEAPRVPKTFGERHIFIELPPPPGKLADSTASHTVALCVGFAFAQNRIFKQMLLPPGKLSGGSALASWTSVERCCCMLACEPPCPRAAALQAAAPHMDCCSILAPQYLHVSCLAQLEAKSRRWTSCTATGTLTQAYQLLQAVEQLA